MFKQHISQNLYCLILRMFFWLFFSSCSGAFLKIKNKTMLRGDSATGCSDWKQPRLRIATWSMQGAQIRMTFGPAGTNTHPQRSFSTRTRVVKGVIQNRDTECVHDCCVEPTWCQRRNIFRCTYCTEAKEIDEESAEKNS